jgi:hypothetical protein
LTNGLAKKAAFDRFAPESLIALGWNHRSVWIGIIDRFELESPIGLNWNH